MPQTNTSKSGLWQRAFLLFAFLFPIAGGEGSFFGLAPGYGSLFLVSWTGIVLGVWGILGPKGSRDFQRGDLLRILLTLFCLWSWASLLWTCSYDHSAYLFVPVVIGCLLFLSLNEPCRNEAFSKWVVGALVASSFPLSLYAMVQIFLGEESGIRPPSAFKDPNTFGSYLGILFPLILYLILHTSRRQGRRFFYMVLILNGASLYAVASRGPALLALLSLALILVHETRKRGWKRGAAIQLLLAVAGFCVALAGLHFALKALGHFSLLERILDVREMVKEALALRFAYWHAALCSFLEQPWLGGGLNTLQQTIFPFLEPGTFTRFPHNIVLQFLSELGIMGSLFFIASVGMILWSGFNKKELSPLRFYCALAFLNLAGYALFDITFQCTGVVLLFFILAALIRPSNPSKAAPGSGKGYKTALAVMIMLVGAGGLHAAYESWRIFRVHIDLSTIGERSRIEPAPRIKDLYEQSIKRPHVMNLQSYSNWLLKYYMRAGDEACLERGLEVRIKAYERGGRNPCQAYDIAMAYMTFRRMDEAEVWFQKAVQGFPSSMTVWRDYMKLFMALGRDDEAARRMDLLIKGYRMNPGMGKYYSIPLFDLEEMRAAVCERNGYHAKALGIYRSLIRRYGNRSYLEDYDPMRSSIVRMPLEQRLNAIKVRIQELKGSLKQKKR